MGYAIKRQHVMLTHRIKLDIFYHDQFIIVSWKNRVVGNFDQILMIALGQKTKGFSGTFWGIK